MTQTTFFSLLKDTVYTFARAYKKGDDTKIAEGVHKLCQIFCMFANAIEDEEHQRAIMNFFAFEMAQQQIRHTNLFMIDTGVDIKQAALADISSAGSFMNFRVFNPRTFESDVIFILRCVGFRKYRASLEINQKSYSAKYSVDIAYHTDDDKETLRKTSIDKFGLFTARFCETEFKVSRTERMPVQPSKLNSHM